VGSHTLAAKLNVGKWNNPVELLEKLPKIEIYPIGEFRMGAMGYGLTIRTAYGTYHF
jgi:hypothetical protein